MYPWGTGEYVKQHPKVFGWGLCHTKRASLLQSICQGESIHTSMSLQFVDISHGDWGQVCQMCSSAVLFQLQRGVGWGAVNHCELCEDLPDVLFEWSQTM